MTVCAQHGFQDIREVHEIILWWIKLTERCKWQPMVRRIIQLIHFTATHRKWDEHTLFLLCPKDLSKMGISLRKWVNTKDIFHHFQPTNLTMECLGHLLAQPLFQGKGVFGQASYFMDQIRPEPLHTVLWNLQELKVLHWPPFYIVLHMSEGPIKKKKKTWKVLRVWTKILEMNNERTEWNSKWKTKSLSLWCPSKAKVEVKHKFSQHPPFRNHSTPLFPPLSQTRGWPTRRALKGN